MEIFSFELDQWHIGSKSNLPLKAFSLKEQGVQQESTIHSD